MYATFWERFIIYSQPLDHCFSNSCLQNWDLLVNNSQVPADVTESPSPAVLSFLHVKCSLYLLQVARTLMVTRIPKELTDPSLVIKHFQ